MLDYSVVVPKLVERRHSRSRCMECKKPPVVDVLWAEGHGRAWFCREHFSEWSRDMMEDIVGVYFIQDGEVPKKIGENRHRLKPVGKKVPRRTIIKKLDMNLANLQERGGPGSGHHGHAGRPGERGGSAPSGLGGGDRVWTGERQSRAPDKPSKLRTGQIGESIVLDLLNNQYGEIFKSVSQGTHHTPIDLAGDSLAIEVKTGVASNGRSAQHWRATIGQPGPTERELLAQMTPKEKREHNAYKSEEILRRKRDAVAALSQATGREITAVTFGVILAPDGSRGDVYMIPDFHLRLGWNEYAIDDYYIGTFQP